MASRENQGLQISLILFVLVSIVLSVMTFIFYRSASELRNTAETERQTAATARDNFQTENFKVQYLQHILGVEPLSEAQLQPVEASIASDPKMAAIQQAYQQAMDSYYSAEEANKNLGDLPSFLLVALRNKNAAHAGLSEEIERLNQANEDLQRTEEGRTKAAEKGLEDARSQLAEVQRSAREERDRMTAENQQALNTLASAQEKFRSDVAALTKQNSDLETEKGSLERIVEDQSDRLVALVDQPFEVPDGRVVSVSQTARTIWINLGLADGLQRQTTFSIFDREAMNVGPRSDAQGAAARGADDAKGKVEVTQVLGEHLAEARILDDVAANPIMRGDLIFSPAWKPGRRVHFALAGLLDLDRDGRSDRELVHNIISMGGGVVDAEVRDDGTISGDLATETRYLVLGETPQDRRQLEGYSRLIERADQLGVQHIGISVLLNLMGYESDVRTVPMGAAARPGGAGTDAFRERRPPPSNGNSAFPSTAPR